MRLSSAHDNPGALPVIDAAGLRVLPGFIDVHTHGAAGVDVNAADVEGLRKIGRFFASQGVTGWLCFDSHGHARADAVVHRAGETGSSRDPYDGAALLGIHLEGPCLSSEYKGAMPEHLLMHEASPDLFARYQEAAGGHVLYTTLAPEVPGVPDLIPELAKMGITAAIGHSGAGYDLSMRCVEAGAKAATHVGNAMRLFHQHDPRSWRCARDRPVLRDHRQTAGISTRAPFASTPRPRAGIASWPSRTRSWRRVFPTATTSLA